MSPDPVRTASTKKIDIHCHSMGPAYRQAISSLGPIIRTPEWSVELAIEFMNRQGTQSAVLSLSTPGTHLGDDDKARDLARRCNEESASFISQYPRRLGALMTLPLPDVDGALLEAEYAADALKLDGVGLLSSYDGKYLGHPEFDPVLEFLNERAAVVLIHPNNHPSTRMIRENLNPGIGNFLVEFLFDTTRAALNLVFSDAFERYPEIRFILCHAGGTIPFVAWRVAEIASRQMTVAPWNRQYPSKFMERYGASLTVEDVLLQFRKFWYDTALSAGRQSLSSLKEVADPSRILFGSDWPYCPETMTQDMLNARQESGLFTATEQAAIDRGNALNLFPRFS
jgi:predicted TIM-barrel fold metal-dependent hydrolase